MAKDKNIKRMIKAQKKIDKFLTEKFSSYGIDKVKYKGEYSYSFKKNRIDYKITNNKIEDKWFNEFVKDRFRYKIKSDFLISVLHELGHAVANEEINGDIYDFCMAEKARIAIEMMATDDEEKGKALSYQYFNLPDEIMATQWAVNYAETHKKQLKKWRKELDPYINEWLSAVADHNKEQALR